MIPADSRNKKWRDKHRSSVYIRAMVIGGWDMYFPNTKSFEESITRIREIVAGVWPDATYEKDEDDWFIYMNRETQSRLDEFGVEDYSAGAFLYVLLREEETTVVYEKGTDGENLAVRMRDALSESKESNKELV